MVLMTMGDEIAAKLIDATLDIIGVGRRALEPLEDRLQGTQLRSRLR